MLSFIVFCTAILSCLAAGPVLKDCLPGGSAIVLSNGVMTPYPPTLPGKVNVSFDLEVKKEIKNFALQVTIVKDLDGFPVTIPCIDGVGSCLTEDACSVLDGMFPGECPPELPQCKCPFKPVKRQVRNLQVDLPALPDEIKELAAGKYDIKLELLDSDSADTISCLDVKIEVAVAL